MAEINASIKFDQRLYAEDIEASLAHAEMLKSVGILTKADEAAIRQGLLEIKQKIETGKFEFSPLLEDVHMNIEAALFDLIGEPARRLHTARSRNDQVATDIRLWLRHKIDVIDKKLELLQRELLLQAETHSDTLMPGFTHLQPAQPVTFGHHLMAYVEMLGRDRARMKDCRGRVNELPLGAAALAGTSFPIDRLRTAKTLSFERPLANSIDAVSARDFALEFLASASITGMHLSRMAEEIVIWSSPAFGFIGLSEAFTTGSSIMPQKRNPDAAELIRAKSGRLLGSFTTLFVVLKGLALAYGKDMQEDKEPLFDAVDTLLLSIAAMAGMVKDLKVNQDAMRRALEAGFITATDLADWLVRKLNMPFRDAHHVTGKIVRLAEEKNVTLALLPLALMQSVEPRISKDIFSVLLPENAVKSRQSLGGTAPQFVKRAIVKAKKQFLQ